MTTFATEVIEINGKPTGPLLAQHHLGDRATLSEAASNAAIKVAADGAAKFGDAVTVIVTSPGGKLCKFQVALERNGDRIATKVERLVKPANRRSSPKRKPIGRPALVVGQKYKSASRPGTPWRWWTADGVVISRSPLPGITTGPRSVEELREDVARGDLVAELN